MKERPILFSSPMVRALLDGSKTQTRRLMKPQPIRVDGGVPYFAVPEKLKGIADANYGIYKVSPYGKVGDQLWVRETFAYVGNVDPGWLIHRASDYMEQVRAYGFDNYLPQNEVKWKPSIFMPRKASRIQLEITGVRVERLNDISEYDAVWEGYKGYGVDG